MAPSLVFFLLAYATIGTWLTTAVFGKRLMQLQFSQLQKEGDLRFDLVRARENSGALTLCHSGKNLKERHRSELCFSHFTTLNDPEPPHGKLMFHKVDVHKERCAYLRL